MNTLTPTELAALSPPELEQRRREICKSLQALPRGYDDPDAPIELLHELAIITSTLRRRTSGPPKAAKPAKTSKLSAKPTLDSLTALFSGGGPSTP